MVPTPRRAPSTRRTTADLVRRVRHRSTRVTPSLAALAAQVFRDNRAFFGGAINIVKHHSETIEVSMTLIGCTFEANEASHPGLGALSSVGDSNFKNLVYSGGALNIRSYVSGSGGKLPVITLLNCNIRVRRSISVARVL